MSKKDETAEYLFARIVVVWLLLAVVGWGLHVLWGWFVVPLGMPRIGVAHATGLWITVSYCWKGSPKKDKTISELTSGVLWHVGAALAVGWVVHWTMGL